MSHDSGFNLKKKIDQQANEIQKLTQSLEEIQYIFSEMPGYVYWKNSKSQYMGCNRNLAEFSKLGDPLDIVGKTDYDFQWGLGKANQFIKEDQEVMSTRKSLVSECEMPDRRPDGKFLFVRMDKIPFCDQHGNVVGVLAISTDITEQKEMEKLIKQSLEKEVASKSKSEFIANMSHDLRTPITGMLGMVQDMLYTADQAKSSISDTDTQRSSMALKSMIETVQRDSQLLMSATDELLQLCNEILEVTRIEAGASDQHLESFALNDLLNHTIELLQPTAHHKKLQLSYALDPLVPCYLKGSRIYLDRIVLNLIGNGLKFTEKGEVRIGVSLNEGTVDASMGQTIRLKIQVKDTGIGIPEDKFDEIFEHFSRLTSSYEGVYKGSGLGLYTVKRYIEAMEGTIDVSSEIGSGTCFTIILPFVVSDHANRGKQSIRTPVSVQPATEVNLLKEQRSVSAQDAGASILIVEDNPIAAMAAKLAFKPFDCYIDMAASGAEAVAMAEQNHYDLIFMDVGLPDFSGIEATQKIRALNDSIKSQVPIVALTGHADNSEIQQDAIDSGMQEILIKPAQARALRTVLERFVFQKKV